MIGIYKITNKLNNKCYIGQSIDIERRWKEHIASIKSKKQNQIYLAFRKYGLTNFSFEIIELCEEQDLDEKEMYWIKYYDSYNNGYNMTIGGEGKRLDYDYITSQYKIYKTMQDTALHSNCSIQTVSNALKAYNITPNYNGSTGIGHQIKQIDPQTLKVIKIYNSISQAMQEVGAKNNAAISKVISGQMDTAYGYIWKDITFDETKLKPIQLKGKYNNKILQKIDKNTNEVLCEYNSTNEAAKDLGKKQSQCSGIYKVCKGEQKTAYGYKWKFVDERREK